VLLAQLTDTHIVRAGSTYFGVETDRYLADAIAALHELDPRPDCIVVTGDLTNFGRPSEYERFARVMATCEIPYVAIPGNHDDRDAMRAHLPPAAYGDSGETRVRFAIDTFAVRVIGLDGTGPPPWPGGSLDAASLAWLEAKLADTPAKPTAICVHQPPFRTGLHYLDAFGFGGRRRFAAALARHPHVGLVLCGHIHCVRSARIGSALALSAPSTAPQRVPELFEARTFALRREAPGFALHEWSVARGFSSTVYRRDDGGRYVPTAEYVAPGTNAR
jgi:Icc protein